MSVRSLVISNVFLLPEIFFSPLPESLEENHGGGTLSVKKAVVTFGDDFRSPSCKAL